jgi:hypothetical protein
MDEEYLSINAVLGLDGVDWYDDIAIICFIMIGELSTMESSPVEHINA